MKQPGLNCIWIVIILVFLACSSSGTTDKNDNDAEENLVEFFQEELSLMKSFQQKPDAYVMYLDHQNRSYKNKQIRLNRVISSVNENFEKVPVGDRSRYQRKWKEKLQPIINDMHHMMRKIIIVDTANLNPKTMARIEKLTIEFKEQEKQLRRETLKPDLFEEPEL